MASADRLDIYSSKGSRQISSPASIAGGMFGNQYKAKNFGDMFSNDQPHDGSQTKIIVNDYTDQ